MALKTAELEKLKEEIERLEQDLAVERRNKELALQETDLANRELASIRQDHDKIVKAKVNEVLGGIEKDVCRTCKRFFKLI